MYSFVCQVLRPGEVARERLFEQEGVAENICFVFPPNFQTSH